MHVMDDMRRIAMVETLTVTSGATVSPVSPRERYQLNNQIESSNVELTQSGAIIGYEEHFPFGATSFRSAVSPGLMTWSCASSNTCRSTPAISGSARRFCSRPTFSIC